MNKYTVIIPNRFEDIIQPLLDSFKTYGEDLTKIVIVADNHGRSYGCGLIKMDGNFIFSRSANAGIDYADPDDIILLNDDVRLLHPRTFDILKEMAYTDPSIGVMVPLVDGGCGNHFMRSNREDLWKDNTSGIHYCRGKRGSDLVTFACAYIKRRLLNQIGLMDENFVGYGFDDIDMCIRAKQAGWKLAVTNKAKVQHGNGGEEFIRGSNWSSSYMRNRIGGARKNMEYLMEKHPLSTRSV